ncbi:hypothetical protein FRC07_007053 [Ceratobasidium sp. 392]|nr:hypothetical protein FRC07_007053 [Ceratobasidium sp. 392]
MSNPWSVGLDTAAMVNMLRAFAAEDHTSAESAAIHPSTFDTTLGSDPPSSHSFGVDPEEISTPGDADFAHTAFRSSDQASQVSTNGYITSSMGVSSMSSTPNIHTAGQAISWPRVENLDFSLPHSTTSDARTAAHTHADIGVRNLTPHAWCPPVHPDLSIYGAPSDHVLSDLFSLETLPRHQIDQLQTWGGVPNLGIVPSGIPASADISSSSNDGILSQGSSRSSTVVSANPAAPPYDQLTSTKRKRTSTISLKDLGSRPMKSDVDEWVDRYSARCRKLDQGYICPACRRLSRRPSALKIHLYHRYRVPVHKCSEKCGDAFSTKANMQRHASKCDGTSKRGAEDNWQPRCGGKEDEELDEY